MTISVLHVAQPTDGGVARCILDLVADQLERGWDVTLACPPEGHLADQAGKSAARLLPWTAGRSPGPGVAVEILSFRRLLGGARPDVVHLHSSKAGLAGRLAIRNRIPTVFQPHGWSFEAVAGPLETAVIAWERLGARWASALACVSRGEQERGASAGVRGRWQIVPNGIDLRRFTSGLRDTRATARQRLGLDGGPLVVCLGRLCEAKGQDVLIDAWALVRERVPQARVVFVGDGPDAAELHSRAAPGITFAGERRDVQDWLAAADVVAIPSRWEGLSYAMLEAMASARSVVSTDVPGARDALGADVGAIVPVKDVAALADAIAERLLDPHVTAEEGLRARRKAEADYDLRQTTERMAEVYSAVLNGGSSRSGP